MFMEAMLLALLAGIGILDGRIFGQTMFDRPLVTGMFVGLILGDIKTGVIIGAQLELIWMGIAGIGAATPPDTVTGGILGTAFAIISGQGVEVALVLAVPIAFLAQSLGILVRIANLYFSNRAVKYAQKADFKGVAMMLWIPALLFFLSTSIPTFLAINFGADKVSILINAMPDVVLGGLKVAGKLLPAIGFALLMDMLLSRKMAVFFLLGFLLAAYMKLDITAIALIGGCIAVIVNMNNSDQPKNTNGSDSKLLKGDIDYE